MSRCLLLPTPVGQGELELLLLPPGLKPEQALEQDQCYAASVPGCLGARLHWSSHSPLAAWQHNPLASRLAGVQVCGDAVLTLKAGEERELQQQVDMLAARHLRNTPWRLAGSWAPGGDGCASTDSSAEPANSPAADAPPTPSGCSQQQPTARAAAAPHVLSAPPPSLPVGQPPGRPVPTGHRQQQQRGNGAGQPHEVQVFECEPRQQLLWTIAGRVTSLSWQAAGDAAPAPAPLPAPMLAPATAAAATPVGPGNSAALELPAAGKLLPAKHRSSLDHSPWSDMRPEVLAMVLAQAGHSSSTARTLSQVCATWRRGLAEERGALQQLRFARLELLPAPGGIQQPTARGTGPAEAPGAAPAASTGSRAAQLPWVVQCAVKSGNVAATVLAARWLEKGQAGLGAQQPPSPTSAVAAARVAGARYGGGPAAAGPAAAQGGAASRRSAARCAADAARYYAKAAKLGHPLAQWKLGYWHYKGQMGLSHDGEEALLWLNRAAKQLAEVVAAALPVSRTASASSGPAGPAPPAPAAARAARAAPAAAAAEAQPPLPPLMSMADCRVVLAQAAHILGYMHLDGEGTRPDTAAAIRWFRLAEMHGCRDAGRVLGSLYNTGQYA